jgi:hypothetical protein
VLPPAAEAPLEAARSVRTGGRCAGNNEAKLTLFRAACYPEHRPPVHGGFTPSDATVAVAPPGRV